MPRCSPILKLSLLYWQPIYFLSVTATYSLFISFLLTYLAVLFIPCLTTYLPLILLFIFIHCLLTCSADFFSFHVRLLSCLFIPCLPVYSVVSLLLPAHLFSCLFIPCLLVCSVVYLFLPAHLFSCLFIPSRPPIQLFINSLPAKLAPRSPSTVYITIRILVGFGRACAPVRCAHPFFKAHHYAKRGAARPPPVHRSFAASYLPLKTLP